jgi:hypothetical protein
MGTEERGGSQQQQIPRQQDSNAVEQQAHAIEANRAVADRAAICLAQLSSPPVSLANASRSLDTGWLGSDERPRARSLLSAPRTDSATSSRQPAKHTYATTGTSNSSAAVPAAMSNRHTRSLSAG